MAINQNLVGVPAQSKNLDTAITTTTAGLVHRQVISIADPETATSYARVSGDSLQVSVQNATLAVTQSGTWNITNISGTVSLPTGASTATLQTTGNTSLNSIDTKTPALVGGRVPIESNLVQGLTDAQLRANDVPVSAVSLPLPTGASTSALQTTGNSSLSSIDAKTPSLSSGRVPVESNLVQGLTDTQLRASAVPVSAASLPLPTGAATSAKQDDQTDILNALSDGLLGNVIAALSTATPLNTATTFTSAAEDVSAHPSIIVSCKTDQDGILYIDFSTDGTNWDSTLTYTITANTNEAHRLTVTKQYARVRLSNTSASNQTFLRLQSISGSQTVLSSPLNLQIQSDADSLVTRPTDFNLLVAEGLYQNRRVTIKDGLNSDVDTATVPEDLSNEGGVYAGFPAAAAAAEIVVAGADTGTVWYSYLASSTDTEYTFASKAVTGAGTYSLGHNIWRCNYAYFANSSGSINVSAITIRHTATPTNVFCVIDAGYGQSFCAAYTVPAGSKIYLDRITGNLRGSTSGSAEGFFWYRPNGQSPILRFPFELQFGQLYFDDVDYLIEIPALTDMIPRITSASVNNLSVKVSYRFIKVKS